MKEKCINTIVTGVCVDLSSEGKGIIKDKEKVIFCDGLFPQEKADVKILYSRGGVFYGKVLKLYNKSSFRIDPKCKVCTACGGCQFQQLAYKKQLEYKTLKVKNSLLRIGEIDTKVNECIGMDNPYNYRNKIQVPIGYDKQKRIISGFYKAMSHEIIPINECYIEDVRSQKIIHSIKSLMNDFRLRPYNEDTRIGELRHILIRTSFYKKEIMVVLIMNVDTFPGRNNFVKALVKMCPEISTVVQNTNKRKTNVILGEKEEVLYGKGYINDILCGLTFRISSKSFYQINPKQCEVLYDKAISFANIRNDEVVLDAYSGIGTIGLIASKNAKKVISVEMVKDAIIDGKKNAKANGVENIDFICDDATKYILEAKDKNLKIDVVFMDPPRNGSTPDFLNSLLSLKPKKIVYVSCDPATLSRDLKLLKNKYDILDVQPVDMFPMTYHVETVVCLSQRKSDETVKIEVDGDALLVTKNESKATYEDIQKYIFDKYGVKVSSLDISMVKTKCGIKERKNYNLSKSNYYKRPNITDENERIILEALKSFKMIG